MKILKYSNEQFAGMTDQNIVFDSGMNVVVGNNESGKSTMISGIYNTLLTPAKIDGRKDKKFIDTYFPSNGQNCIDGIVKVEVNGQKVTVKKEWDKKYNDFRTSLILESGKSSGIDAEEKIKELLGYGEAVFDNIIFGRQNNEDQVLNWFFSFLNLEAEKIENKGNDQFAASIAEVKEYISGVFSAAGGVSEDLFLKKLDDKIKELSSKWNLDFDMPVENRGKRWSKGIGEILQCYYALEDKETELKNAEKAEEELIKSEISLKEKEKDKQFLNEKKKDFYKQKSDIDSKDKSIRQRENILDEIKRLNKVKGEWPVLKEEMAIANTLSKEVIEIGNRRKKDELVKQIEAITKVEAKLVKIESKLKNLCDIQKDFFDCEKLDRMIEIDSDKLKSAKLHANVKMLGKENAILSSATGEETEVLNVFDEDVDGYINISIPSVAEIMISPQEIDVRSLEKLILENRSREQKLFEKYNVLNFDELISKKDKYIKDARDYDKCQLDLDREMSGKTIDELESELSEISINQDILVREDIEDNIISFLKGKKENSLNSRMAVLIDKYDQYEKEYESEKKLQSIISSKENDLHKINLELERLSVVAYTKEEFDSELSQCDKAIDKIELKIKDLYSQIISDTNYLDDIDVNILRVERDDWQKKFKDNKKTCEMYLKIKQNFEELRDNQGEKYKSFSKQFNEYLSKITGGKIRYTEEEELESENRNLFRKDLLSKGTKHTVLLAIKLALLNYYYQDEGAVIVLDDAILDMDPNRRENAVGLLKDFAKDNQVIFTTCDPGIAKMLGGNQIQI